MKANILFTSRILKNSRFLYYCYQALHISCAKGRRNGNYLDLVVGNVWYRINRKPRKLIISITYKAIVKAL
jgi:hypothetical protein